jgi:hypothetical protein
MKSALIHADGQMENMKQIGVSATIQTRIKFACDSQEERIKGNIPVALNQWGEEPKNFSWPATWYS